MWNYVGMVFDTSIESEAEVTIKGFVDELLMWYGIWWKPSGRDSYDEKEGAILCSEDFRKRFHSTLVQLLHLAKRGRPDVLTGVSYLVTKLRKFDDGDIRTLERVMKYISATIERGMVFRPGKGRISMTQSIVFYKGK